MATIKQLQQTIEEGEALKLVTQSFGEIALQKLKKIRSEVERNRLFFNEIFQVYKMVHLISEQQYHRSLTKSRKTISIALTSNYRFYGDLNYKLIKYFMVNTAKYETDRVVIGKTGVEYLQSFHYSHAVSKIAFKEDIPDSEELKQLAGMVSTHQRVLVYYPRFQSVLTQLPAVRDLSETPQTTGAAAPVNYILEPEIDKILSFFNNTVNGLLLEQVFLESELARLGARLISMNEAEQEAEKFIGREQKSLAIAKRSINNIRLLESISTLSRQFKSISGGKF